MAMTTPRRNLKHPIRWEIVLVALLAALPPTLTSFASVVLNYGNAKTIQKIELNTNSMKDALVNVTRSDATQLGHAAGVADEKAKNTVTIPLPPPPLVIKRAPQASP